MGYLSSLFKQKQVVLPDYSDIIGLIASKNPVESLERTVISLLQGGASRVIVVDDGSDDPLSLEVLNHIKNIDGTTVIHLPKNIGKAAALKEGFKLIPKDSAIIQTDDDTISGDLRIPRKMLEFTDIVDIRVEAKHATSLLGYVQELNYWIINAFIKRMQNVVRARLWMSGASVMYTYAAGQEIVMQTAYTITEDTEGLFRARSKGYKVQFCHKKQAQFITMVPENLSDLIKQWQRWSLGNGQVIGIYGLGGGIASVAIFNALSWSALVLLPIPMIIINGVFLAFVWNLVFSLAIGLIGSIYLRRPQLIIASVLLPVVIVLWGVIAVDGLFKALKQPLATGHILWSSPKRTKGW